MENLIFNVEKVPLKDLLKVDLNPVSGIDHAIVAKGKILHTCSKDYGLVTNETLIRAFTQHLGNQKIETKVTGSNHRDSKFAIEIAMMSRSYNFGSKKHPDQVHPTITLYNSYNGTQKYSFTVRFWRQICSNGMGRFESQALSLLHTPQVTDGAAVSKAMVLLTQFMDTYEDELEPLLDLQDSPVRDIEARIDAVAEAVGFPPILTEYAKERAVAELNQYHLEPSDWLVYNALNYQMNHNAGALVGHKAARLDNKVMQYLLTY